MLFFHISYLYAINVFFLQITRNSNRALPLSWTKFQNALTVLRHNRFLGFLSSIVEPLSQFHLQFHRQNAYQPFLYNKKATFLDTSLVRLHTQISGFYALIEMKFSCVFFFLMSYMRSITVVLLPITCNRIGALVLSWTKFQNAPTPLWDNRFLGNCSPYNHLSFWAIFICIFFDKMHNSFLLFSKGQQFLKRFYYDWQLHTRISVFYILVDVKFCIWVFVFPYSIFASISFIRFPWQQEWSFNVSMDKVSKCARIFAFYFLLCISIL